MAVLQEMAASVGCFLFPAAQGALVAVVLAVLSWAALILYVAWWKPLGVKARLEAQGLKGPPYRFLYGNVAEMREMSKAAEAESASLLSSSSSSSCHLLLPRLLPHYAQWAPRFGASFLYFLGPAPRLALGDPDHCRHVLSNRSGHFPKPSMRPELLNILGAGLGTLEGPAWAHHRRIVAPAFLPHRLRAMAPTVARLCLAMARAWQARLQAAGLPSIEVDVHEEFRALTADVVAHTAVGSRYAAGVTQVFHLQRRQQLLFSPFGVSPVIPGSRFFPTPTNLRRWKLRRQIASSLHRMLQARFASVNQSAASNHSSSSPDMIHDVYGPDLLGLLMAAHANQPPDTPKNLRIDMQSIMDEVQTFFFAGHETTTTMLTWTIMLLALHQEWQDKAREEVLAVCGKKDEIDAEALIHLKVVGMILNESLRLYPPATAILREASQDTKLGDMLVPKGTTMFIPVIALHVDPNYWGADAHVFNPQRFADGILKACRNPSAYLPFGAGPRICVGQNFALMETKIALSTILKHFRFSLSPLYKHEPCTFLTLQPKHGMHVILESL